MAEIGAQIELSEGDLVMTFNKTIDLMRQIWEMLVNVKPEHPLRSRLQQAESLMRRDIVEHSLALGFAPIELPELARGELEAAKAARPAALPPRGPPAQGIEQPGKEANGSRDKKQAKRSSRSSPTAADGHHPPVKKAGKGTSRRAPDEVTDSRSKSGSSRTRRSRPSSSP